MIYGARNRYLIAGLAALFFIITTIGHYKSPPNLTFGAKLSLGTLMTAPSYPKYRPEPLITPPPIVDNFPLAAAASSAKELPPIPSWNKPPKKHVDLDTPLFIGFTRNWRMLQQVVVSYVTAGWPPEDIYVVENTGVMDSNERELLSLQNPFFLNYTRLHMFGVKVIRTPTLLTFAQLQNFYTNTALEKKWKTYFWSHMDVAALSWEGHFKEAHPDLVGASADHSAFESLYHKAVQTLRETKDLQGDDARWAVRFFHYDHLTLVHTDAFVEVGGWDTMIPYYMTDCDMHARLVMAKLQIKDLNVGMIFDLAASLDDLIVLYRKKNTGVRASFLEPNILTNKIIAAENKRAKGMEEHKTQRRKREDPATVAAVATVATPEPYWENIKKWEDDDIHTDDFVHMVHTLDAMAANKRTSKAGRNTWQAVQKGGKGEPFYRDSEGFEKAVQMTIDHGKAVYFEKWGHKDCDIVEKGLVTSDAWRVEHDWFW